MYFLWSRPRQPLTEQAELEVEAELEVVVEVDSRIEAEPDTGSELEVEADSRIESEAELGRSNKWRFCHRDELPDHKDVDTDQAIETCWRDHSGQVSYQV